eukprot:550806_1
MHIPKACFILVFALVILQGIDAKHVNHRHRRGMDRAHMHEKMKSGEDNKSSYAFEDIDWTVLYDYIPPVACVLFTVVITASVVCCLRMNRADRPDPDQMDNLDHLDQSQSELKSSSVHSDLHAMEDDRHSAVTTATNAHAQSDSARVHYDTQVELNRVRSETQSEVHRVRSEAQSKLERVRSEAQAELERVRSESQAKCNASAATLANSQAELTRVRADAQAQHKVSASALTSLEAELAHARCEARVQHGGSRAPPPYAPAQGPMAGLHACTPDVLRAELDEAQAIRNAAVRQLKTEKEHHCETAKCAMALKKELEAKSSRSEIVEDKK